MEKICTKCAKDPASHSFKKVNEKNGVTLYFTQPAKARQYDDTEGILSHVDSALAANGNKKWRCIIDGAGFDVKHAMEVKTGMGLVSLLTEKYGPTMHEIKIINPTWHITGVLRLAESFMDATLLSRIHLLDDNKPHSVLEFM